MPADVGSLVVSTKIVVLTTTVLLAVVLECKIMNIVRNYRKSCHSGNSCDFENYFGVISKYVPDQAMSVRDILTRYASGIPPNVQSEPFYSEDEDDLRFTDMAVLHEMQIINNQRIKDLQDELENPVSTTSDQSDPVSASVPQSNNNTNNI